MEPFQAKKNSIRGSKIGAFSYVVGTTTIVKSDVGRYCSIATGSAIGLAEHPIDRLSTHSLVHNSPRYLGHPVFASMKDSAKADEKNKKRTKIGHDVWIGANAVVLRGVEIGTGAVIGAGAVVTKDVPPYAIVVGMPAKIMRYRFSPELIARLLESEWWEYHLDQSLIGVDYSDVEQFLDKLALLKTTGEIRTLADVLIEYKRSRRRPVSPLRKLTRAFKRQVFSMKGLAGAAVVAALFAILWQAELAASW